MNHPFVIGITGGSGSGKTFFLKGLSSCFSEDEICLISQDNYYKPRDQQPTDEKGIKNFDLPESIDRADFYKDVLSLKAGKKFHARNTPIIILKRDPSYLNWNRLRL